MTLPEIAGLDTDFAHHLSATADFDLFTYDETEFVTAVVDGWAVGYNDQGRYLLIANGATDTFSVFNIAGGGEDGKHAARAAAFAVIASLRLAVDPIAAAVEWMHAMVKRHGYTAGLGMAHKALGRDFYHEAFGQWEDEDDARRDAQNATA